MNTENPPAVTRSWKRLMAVGCSHGSLIDHKAENAILEFAECWKPEKRIHLGDFCDTTAFRSGAKGTSDETEPVAPDIDAGLDFLERFGCNLVFNGNHEIRIWKLAQHYNAIVSGYSKCIIEKIQEHMRRIGAEYVEEWSIRSWKMVGNYKFGHGYIYNENAARDHAEAHGNVVVAHTHRTGFAKGRRDDSPTGICVGTLSDIPNMDYASSRRSTLSWSNGFVWGEYTDNECVLWLSEKSQNQTEWRLPIV